MVQCRNGMDPAAILFEAHFFLSSRKASLARVIMVPIVSGMIVRQVSSLIQCNDGVIMHIVFSWSAITRVGVITFSVW